MLKLNETARHTLKKTILIFFLLFITTLAFADTSITRGPAIGEIYYKGPTVTGEGIYHSTDFGETATCMDSTLNTNIYFMSICADLTPGVLYGVTMGEGLYISYNYGQQESWTLRNGGISLRLLSGRTNGHLYSGKTKHSEDYGNTFIYHACQGYFGDQKASEIGVQGDVGYALVKEYGINDSLWLLVSYDNFESFEIQHSFNWYSVFDYSLSRGSEVGELFLIKSAYYGDGSMLRELWYSNDYGENWIFKNHLLSGIMVGGKQSGELFVLANYTQLLGEINHTYIYHSLDYGETFEMYHPFSHGPDPYYSNFEATPLEGSAPLTVQFTDLSSGDNIQTWEWDFNLDGTIDSYEQNPEYTFQDTGYYSIKLKIYFDVLEDGYVKSNYIHVTNGNGIGNEELPIINFELSNYPNPFNPSTAISFILTQTSSIVTLEIYNLKGQKVKALDCINHVDANARDSRSTYSVIWDGKDDNDQTVSSGIYFARLKVDFQTATTKLLLMK